MLSNGLMIPGVQVMTLGFLTLAEAISPKGLYALISMVKQVLYHLFHLA